MMRKHIPPVQNKRKSPPRECISVAEVFRMRRQDLPSAEPIVPPNAHLMSDDVLYARANLLGTLCCAFRLCPYHRTSRCVYIEFLYVV